MNRISGIFLVNLFVLALQVSAAEPPEPSGLSPIGAAYWIGQGGRGGQGVAYDVLSWRSLLRPRHRWFVSMLLGTGTGGAALTTDMWTREGDKGQVTLTLGLAGVTGNLEAGQWKPAAVVTLRINGKPKEE
jgi:hypothetical protein